MAERTLHTPLTDLPGVGPARARALDKLGLSTVADLLAYFPREYEDRTVREGIAWLPADTPVCFAAVVAEPFRTSYIRKGMELTKGRIVDGTGQAAVTFFNQNYVRKALQPGQTYFFYGTLTGEGYRRSMVNPAFEREGAHQLTGGIFPVYPLTAGITNRFLTGLVRAGLACLPQVQETLGDDLRETYDLVPVEQAYGSIHFPASWEALTKARRRLMFEELFCLNLGLTLIRGRRGEQRACPFVRQDLEAFTSRLPFSLTPAQLRSVKEAAADLRRAVPARSSRRARICSAGSWTSCSPAPSRPCIPSLPTATRSNRRRRSCRTSSRLTDRAGSSRCQVGRPFRLRQLCKESVAAGWQVYNGRRTLFGRAGTWRRCGADT